MIIYLPLLVAIIGLIVYLISGNANPSNPPSTKVAEIGRIMFWTGLLAFLLSSGHMETIISKH